MKTSFTLAALTVAAVAAPTSVKKCSSVSQNANFDDLTGVPGVILNTIPTPYKGLLYQGTAFTTVVRTGTTVQPGVTPHSGLNYGAINVASQLSGTPMLTTNYASSKIESFQLESFYFGCVLQLGQGATAVPTACNINVTGYKGSDNTVSASKQVCSQSYSYNPTSILGLQQQAFGSFSDCAKKDIQFAVIQFSLPGGMAAANPLSALVIDDVKYSTKASSC
ncbi:hypothetical protein P153DRAFT_358991 [Dothidotthia symphoricarpi CBS 119687]|uniref:Uncharacterized protein n=1 Tax=Dothidotthia symphoricarpi CBS 119687 TaxID=1392245 RepID=A0A6A6A689_9PLEO|nr:uncharacterized protein P153DRAFT_358991 [Dothidotthia symphoricarpi CBS 119687]KAF2127399.1 hypothetical protein P153DRAFT_358991 [Dothidotthia symphoricarpi CBS 119687]